MFFPSTLHPNFYRLCVCVCVCVICISLSACRLNSNTSVCFDTSPAHNPTRVPAEPKTRREQVLLYMQKQFDVEQGGSRLSDKFWITKLFAEVNRELAYCRYMLSPLACFDFATATLSRFLSVSSLRSAWFLTGCCERKSSDKPTARFLPNTKTASGKPVNIVLHLAAKAPDVFYEDLVDSLRGE